MATHIRLEHGQRIDKADYFREYVRHATRHYTDAVPTNTINHLKDYGCALLMDRGLAEVIVDEEIAA